MSYFLPRAHTCWCCCTNSHRICDQSVRWQCSLVSAWVIIYQENLMCVHYSLNSHFPLCLCLINYTVDMIKYAPYWQCKYVWKWITISAGVSGPAAGADAGKAWGVFHTGSTIHTRGRQTSVFHWWQDEKRMGMCQKTNYKKEVLAIRQVQDIKCCSQSWCGLLSKWNFLHTKRAFLAKTLDSTLHNGKRYHNIYLK